MDHPRSSGTGPTTTPVGARSWLAAIFSALALTAVGSTLLPLWSASGSDEMFATMSLWDAAAIDERIGSQVALVGLILCLLLAVLMIVTAGLLVGRRVPMIAAAVPAMFAALLCLPGLWLLITKPFSSTPKPGLGAGGWLMMIAAIITLVVAVVTLVQALSARRAAAPGA